MLRLDAKDGVSVSEISGFRVITKAPEALLMVGAVVAVTMWSDAMFDSDNL